MNLKQILLIIFLWSSSLSLKGQILENIHPADNLYNHSWITTYAHPYNNFNVPDNYYISLLNYAMPTKNKIITSNFGYRKSFKRMHKGIDIKVYIGDTIYAAFDGQIRVVKYDKNGYGNFIVIRHDNGLETIYGHLSKQLVKINQYVTAGEPIGLGGNTGRSSGSHLHFETRFLGIAIDPTHIFNFEQQSIHNLFYIYIK
jgi:murein DD-endopeptidase MepM/ murein hydrolase activator NlpD